MGGGCVADWCGRWAKSDLCATCVCDLCVRLVCVRLVCVRLVCVRLVCATCVCDLCVRPVCATCVCDLFARRVCSTCLLDLPGLARSAFGMRAVRSHLLSVLSLEPETSSASPPKATAPTASMCPTQLPMHSAEPRSQMRTVASFDEDASHRRRGCTSSASTMSECPRRSSHPIVATLKSRICSELVATATSASSSPETEDSEAASAGTIRRSVISSL